MTKLQRIDDDGRGLPEAIVQHILSFLSMESAARLSLVSKIWYRAWATCPILKLSLDEDNHFRKVRFHRNYDNNIPQDVSFIEKVRQEFLNYAKKSLQRYLNNTSFLLCVEELHLTMRCFAARYHTCTYYFIKKLFNNVERSGVVVKGLRFSYTSFEFGSFTTDLPELLRILEVGILREFDVKGCKLEHEIGKKPMIRCCLLRRLSLEYVHTNEDILKSIISSCPLIESIKFDCCWGLGRIKVVNNTCLKDFSVSSCSNIEAIEVQAPNLESFHCFASCSLRLKLYGPNENLKRISLRCLLIEGSFFQDLAKNFPNLKDLSVVQCSFVKRINISSKSLKFIVLRVDRQVEVEINAPNMVSFEYSGEKIPCFKNLLGSTTTTMSSSGDQQCKYNIEIFGLSLATSNADRFMQLKEMLKKFLVPHKSKMSLSIHFESHVLSNESILSTIPINIAEETGVELEDLTFHMLGFQSSPLSLSSYSTILDILFMICRPKSICLRVEAFSDREFAKFFCERLLMDRRSSGKCSTSWENNFWENELKEVKIVKTVTVDEVEDKAQYFRIEKIFFSLKWKSCFDILNQI